MTQFNPAYPLYVSYIDKSRRFYRHRGFNNPYRWATYTETPFTPLGKLLSESQVGLICTASLDAESAPKKESFAAPIKPPPNSLYTTRLSWHKTATHTDDTESFLPVRRLNELAATGHIGRVADRFYGVPTEYSQRKTREIDAPQILEWCREDGVDVVLITAL